jgi:2-methylcitrate dehydratase PrpD
MTATTTQPTQTLASFLASLRYEDLPDEVVGRTEEFQDPEVDAAYPERWSGLVEIETTGGETITSRVDVPKGDPDNTLSREEIKEKARSLAAFRGGASDEEIALRIRAAVWGKWEGHKINHPDFERPNRSMSMIGG